VQTPELKVELPLGIMLKVVRKLHKKAIRIPLNPPQQLSSSASVRVTESTSS
jgi:hypothetical protein